MVRNIPPPPPNIPMWTHLLSLGIHPQGLETRCKNCGATDDHLKCSYCRQRKEHAYETLKTAVDNNRVRLGDVLIESRKGLWTPTPGQAMSV
jgi:hypothetical protein